jgi:hypothetical protein
MPPPFDFDPVLQLDLEKPVRVEVAIPLNLLPRLTASIESVPVPGNTRDFMSDRNALEAIKPAALTIAELVSNAMFGSTEPISQPFRPIGRWGLDGSLEAVFFILNYRLGIDDIGLNPEYLWVVAEDIDGKLVFRTSVITGERREHDNARYEGTDLDYEGESTATP